MAFWPARADQVNRGWARGSRNRFKALSVVFPLGFESSHRRCNARLAMERPNFDDNARLAMERPNFDELEAVVDPKAGHACAAADARPRGGAA